MWPCFISSDSGKYLCTAFTDNPGHVVKFPALIVLVQVSSTGWPADVWRYLIVSFVNGKS
jgi:hypothetical protein